VRAPIWLWRDALLGARRLERNRIHLVEAVSNMSGSFELFCLASGMEALGEMMDHDAQAVCGPRHARGGDRQAHRWGKTKGEIGFHGGKVEIERPRLRGFDGKEQALPSWEAAVADDWLGKWAINQMLINVATRKFARSVRLPEGDVPASAGAGLTKSAISRRFVALSAARMNEWMASDLSSLDLLVIQIDGIHMDEDLILVAAIGVDAKGDKHPLGLIEGATENCGYWFIACQRGPTSSCVLHHSWPFRRPGLPTIHFSRHIGGNKTRADTWIRLCVATSHWRQGTVSDNKPISGREMG
jgi:hypothetical protein